MNMTSSPVIQRRQRGSMLWLTVALLFSLSLTALLGLSFARIGSYHAFGLKHRVQATYMADAGLNVAYLKLSSLGALSNLTLPYVVVPETALGTGSYQVDLLNNPDDTGGATDTDGVYVIQSIGWAEGKSARRMIQSRLSAGVGPALTPPGVMALGKNTSVKFNTLSFNGHDPDSTVPAIAGVAFEKAGQTWDHGSATVSGDPDYSWASDDFSGFSAQAQQYLNTMSALPTVVYKNGASNNNFGTATSPQLTVIDPSSSYTAATSITGFGVLIVRGRFSAPAGLNFTGLILIEGTAGEMKVRSQFTVNGGVVITPPTGNSTCTNLESTGNANFLYQQSKLELLSSGAGSAMQLRSTVLIN